MSVTIKFYQLPSEYFENTIVLKRAGLIDLLTSYLYTSSEQTNFDVINPVINANYFDLIENAINYIVVNDKFAYKIINITMVNSASVRLQLERDSINTYILMYNKELLNNASLGSSFVYSALNNNILYNNEINYNKSLRTGLTEYNILSSYLDNDLSDRHTAPVITPNKLYKCYYIIVNENYINNFNYDGQNKNGYLYVGGVSLNDLKSYVLKENGVKTNKYLIILPFDNLEGLIAHYGIVFDGSGHAPFITDGGIGVWGDFYQLATDNFNKILATDQTNIIDAGVAYLPILALRPVIIQNNIEPSAYVDAEYCYISKEDFCLAYVAPYLMDDFALSNLSLSLSTELDLYKYEYYLKLNGTLSKLPSSLNMGFNLYFSFTDSLKILLRINNLLTNLGFMDIDITSNLCASIPIYIDGVERANQVNTALWKLQQRQAERSFGMAIAKGGIGVMQGIGTAVLGGFGGDAKTLSSGINSTINSGFQIAGGIISKISSEDTIATQQYNTRFETSSFTGSGELSIQLNYLANMRIVVINYNSLGVEKLINKTGLPVNKIYTPTQLTNLSNTFIRCHLEFSDKLDYTIIRDIVNEFEKGVYLFENDSAVADFAFSGTGLTYHNI